MFEGLFLLVLMEPTGRIELPTCSLRMSCSTTELRWRDAFNYVMCGAFRNRTQTKITTRPSVEQCIYRQLTGERERNDLFPSNR
jgi:hypothetical protein